MRRVFVPALAAGVLLLATAAPGLADPNLPDIGAHRHFVRTATGELVEVGPRLCDNPRLQRAFNQFHSNVHLAVAGSPGPSQAAPGLHNGFGAELESRPCSFSPAP
jgi:hypothetical protein